MSIDTSENADCLSSYNGRCWSAWHICIKKDKQISCWSAWHICVKKDKQIHTYMYILVAAYNYNCIINSIFAEFIVGTMQTCIVWSIIIYSILYILSRIDLLLKLYSLAGHRALLLPWHSEGLSGRQRSLSYVQRRQRRNTHWQRDLCHSSVLRRRSIGKGLAWLPFAAMYVCICAIFMQLVCFHFYRNIRMWFLRRAPRRTKAVPIREIWTRGAYRAGPSTCPLALLMRFIRMGPDAISEMCAKRPNILRRPS